MKPSLLLAILAFPSSVPAAEQPTLPLSGAAVKSKEWVIRKEPPQEEFTGDVSYIGSDAEFHSDWALWDKRPQMWKARGRIRARRRTPEGVLEVWGNEASYDLKNGRGRLRAYPEEEVRFSWAGEDGSWNSQGTCGEAEWNQSSQVLTLAGPVTTESRRPGESLRTLSGWASLETPRRSIHLKEGRPVAEAEFPTWIGALQADELQLGAEGALAARGQVRGWLHPKEKH